MYGDDLFSVRDLRNDFSLLASLFQTERLLDLTDFYSILLNKNCPFHFWFCRSNISLSWETRFHWTSFSLLLLKFIYFSTARLKPKRLWKKTGINWALESTVKTTAAGVFCFETRFSSICFVAISFDYVGIRKKNGRLIEWKATSKGRKKGCSAIKETYWIV